MSREVTPILTAHDCIVAMMMTLALSDSTIRTAALVKIKYAVNNLPIFAEYDIDRLNIIFEKISENYDVAFIDPFDFLCIDQIQEMNEKIFCAFGKNDNNFYMDWGHLQRSGSEHLVNTMPKNFFFVD